MVRESKNHVEEDIVRLYPLKKKKREDAVRGRISKKKEFENTRRFIDNRVRICRIKRIGRRQ